MTTIDPHHRLASALRAQAAALRQRAQVQPAAGAPCAAAGRVAPGVSQVLAQRVRAIAPDDPDRRRKAVRLVLEAEITRVFGAGLVNDTGFPGMLDAIQEQMQQDPETAAAVQALGEHLLATS